ncbi:speedy protein A-like [Orussus abietinus]|uniref:speedy protein A-like n=1 Tax=Orussus abietinus TaxID=222816 RepID=UPI0006260479|nr:speedy protein A-like [Orussus abietinus]
MESGRQSTSFTGSLNPVHNPGVSIRKEDVKNFFRIIDEEMDVFLQEDTCFKLADNYLIAMAFIYFLRAALLPEEYTGQNFLIALYLAHDMEEDEENYRLELRQWASRISDCWDSESIYFIKMRDRLFHRMKYRGVVSRFCCQTVMRLAKPSHKVWQRWRHANHSGAACEFKRLREVCPKCARRSLSHSSNSSSDFSEDVTSAFESTMYVEE